MNQIAATMQQAVAAIQRKDFAQAKRLAQQAAVSQPGNAQILQVLAIAQSEGGDPEQGLATFEKAISLAPQDQGLRFNAAKAAFQQHKYAQVETLCESLPADPAILHLRALARKEDGDIEQAVSLFREAIKQAPGDAQLLNNFGNALIAAGKPLDAIKVLEAARRHDPNSAQILLNFGRANTAAERFETAREAFREAAQMAPQDSDVLFELGKSLVRYSHHEEALPLLSESARQGMRDPEVFILIGSCYSAIELREEAESAFRMALRTDPENIRAYLNLGILFEQDNKLDKLEQLLTEIDQQGLAGDDIDYLRALILQRDGNLEQALALVQSSDPVYLDKIIQHEFVGKVADRLGQYDLAFAAFSDMNDTMALNPDARNFDGTEHSAMIRQRVDTLTREWMDSWPAPIARDDRPVPVMLGGFLRSGTTLLDTILMGHAGAHVREEEAMIARLEEGIGEITALPTLDPVQLGAARDLYYAELMRNGPVPEGQILIDKYPLMTVRAPYIHRVFPEAKYIFSLRHPCDVVLSCFMQNFRVTRAMSSFLKLENAARLYDTVMLHWERAQEVMPLNVHTIRYEDMVDDLEGQIRPLLDFLGLPWDPAILDHQKTAQDRGYIRTPSYAQVTEKIYSRSSGRWQNYRKHLEPILPTLAPWIEKFGYEPVDL